MLIVSIEKKKKNEEERFLIDISDYVLIVIADEADNDAVLQTIQEDLSEYATNAELYSALGIAQIYFDTSAITMEDFIQLLLDVDGVESAEADQIITLATTEEEEEECVDNDALLQENSGNPMATCERLAQGGFCTNNCDQMTMVCCESCGPLCSDDDDDNNDAQVRTPQLSRYCEILVSVPNDDGSSGGVLTNVFWTGNCNETLWNQIRASDDPEALVRAERPAMLSMKLNGPRYFLTYEGTPCCGAGETTPNLMEAPRMEVEGIQFIAVASLEEQVAVGPPTPYASTSVTRNQNFTWCAGCETYQLTDASGDTWIMQSFSQYVDPEMDVASLRTLGERLVTLPPGWTYAAVNLTSDFSYAAVVADVLFDDYENAYTKMYRPGCETCAPPPPATNASSPGGEPEGTPVAPTEPAEEDPTEPVAPEDSAEPAPEEPIEPAPEESTEPIPEDSSEPTPEETSAGSSGVACFLPVPALFVLSFFHWI